MHIYLIAQSTVYKILLNEVTWIWIRKKCYQANVLIIIIEKEIDTKEEAEPKFDRIKLFFSRSLPTR